MVDEAKKRAEEFVNALAPYAEQGLSIVGLEPSCLFTLEDEVLSMRVGEKAQLVANHTTLIDTFLAREASAGKLEQLKPRLKPANERSWCTDIAIKKHSMRKRRPSRYGR
jgi:Fe-S oxidoreductase